MTDRTIKFVKRDVAQPAEGRLQIAKTYKIYVGGAFPRTESGRFFPVKNTEGQTIANASWCSRKDLREAVTSARAAHSKWSGMSAYNRGQILYRVAEMLEGRKGQFVDELVQMGSGVEDAQQEVLRSIDRCVYFAGWADKFQQVFSGVNPVASSHFNFSMQESVGVVGLCAPDLSGLYGLISMIAPTIVGGNTCVALASTSKPLSSITFAEVLQTSDLPGGVVNILTGFRNELLKPMAGHMDVNALVLPPDLDSSLQKEIELASVENLKRCVRFVDSESPYPILDLQEVKTTWHPVGI